MQKKWLIASLLTVFLTLVCALSFLFSLPEREITQAQQIPAYCGEPFVIIGDNIPDFTDREKITEAYELYSELDALNRCGYAMACVGKELMPEEEREAIGQIKPTGWQTVKYDCVDGKYLYNRCHLIGYQLTGENANPQNLITGTRYLNMEGMLPFENMVADYVKETGNHVLYRVTPDFQGDELLARGVIMEGWSVEDRGSGICFCVYVYNVQPGITIDYSTGESAQEKNPQEKSPQTVVYILNTASKRFHLESCGQGEKIKKENQEIYAGNRMWLLMLGYQPSGCCNP